MRYNVFQDDFLPRTATPLEYIFSSIFWWVSFAYCRKFLFLFNLVLLTWTACPAYSFWFAWEIHLFQKRENLTIRGGFMLPVGCIISWRESFAGTRSFVFHRNDFIRFHTWIRLWNNSICWHKRIPFYWYEEHFRLLNIPIRNSVVWDLEQFILNFPRLLQHLFDTMNLTPRQD